MEAIGWWPTRAGAANDDAVTRPAKADHPSARGRDAPPATAAASTATPPMARNAGAPYDRDTAIPPARPATTDQAAARAPFRARSAQARARAETATGRARA